MKNKSRGIIRVKINITKVRIMILLDKKIQYSIIIDSR